MTNNEYWQGYEGATGKKRPPWIDGVGNINWDYNKPDPPKPPKPTATQTAGMIPQVYAQPIAQGLLPQPGDIRPWQPGLRGWRPGWG